jgi:hypothetical protein
LPFRDLTDALFDYFGCRVSDILTIVFESFKNDLVVMLLAEELVEGDDLLFAAELSQNKDSGVFLYVG